MECKRHTKVLRKVLNVIILVVVVVDVTFFSNIITSHCAIRSAGQEYQKQKAKLFLQGYEDR